MTRSSRGSRALPVFAVLALLLGSGCAGTPAPTMGTPTPDNRFVLGQIHRTAVSIDRRIRDLERASLRNIRIQRLPLPRGNAAFRITLNYDGPLEEAVRAVARMIRYRVTVSGRAPVVPEIVSVHLRHRSAQAVLESLGLQTGGRVGLDMDETRDRIEIRYGNARTPGMIGESP